MQHDTFFLPYNRNLVSRARELRKNMTPMEQKLWHKYLRGCSVKVLRQRPIDNFIVDFYIPKCKLVIEVDGDSHFMPEGLVRDAERTAILEDYGLTIIRFTNEEIRDTFEGVCHQITKEIQN